MNNLNEQLLLELDRQVKNYQRVIQELAARISYLERENARRKSETNQIVNSLRKG